MACSKLFSGDLPELSIQIIQNLRNNFDTLYTLALVNRFWCRLAIPLLWEDPFSIKYRKNLSFHFIDTYFLFLNENDKSKIKEIKFYGFEYKPLFNYPNLIKTLNFFRVQLHVKNWLNPTSYNTASSTSSLTCLRREPVEIMNICSQVNDEKLKVIYTVLLNLFIQNNAVLSNLYVYNNYFLDHFCDMVLNHPKFVSDIKILSFGYYRYYYPSNLKSIRTLLSLPPLSTSIKHISFSSHKTELNNFFANIIQSQSQLTSVKFSFPMKCLEVSLLDSLKHSSNTITSINFYSSQFSNTMRFDALSCLTQLESLQFRSCYGLNSNVIQPLLNITTPLKIKTLVILDNRFARLTTEVFTPIQLLMKKIGVYIENLVLSIREDELRRKLFDTVIDFCEKIKFLHLNYINSINIPQLSKMIFIFSNSLEYLTLEVKGINWIQSMIDSKGDLELGSIILKELSKSLPLSLHYLDLSLAISPDDLQIVLENCKQVELKKLLIRNWDLSNVDATLMVIKDFVKENNLDFLAYCINSLPAKEDVRCKNLEKLVEETQTFIKMVKYDDLIIRVSDIDGNLKTNIS